MESWWSLIGQFIEDVIQLLFILLLPGDGVIFLCRTLWCLSLLGLPLYHIIDFSFFLPFFLPSCFSFSLSSRHNFTRLSFLFSLFHVYFFFAVLTPYFIINMNNPTEMVRFDLLSLFFPPLGFFVLFVRLFTCFVSVILTLSFKKLKTVI